MGHAAVPASAGSAAWKRPRAGGAAHFSPAGGPFKPSRRMRVAPARSRAGATGGCDYLFGSITEGQQFCIHGISPGTKPRTNRIAFYACSASMAFHPVPNPMRS